MSGRSVPSSAWPPRLGLAAIGVSVAVTVATGLLGPSAVQAPLPGAGPPFAVRVSPPAWPVIGLQCGALLLGAAGLGTLLLAAGRGWRPAPLRLFAAGVLASTALVCVPPMGTADPHAYASYGRIVTLGANPYNAAPEDFPNDPVASAAKPPWTEEASPYGPLATAEQALVSSIAGESLNLTVLLLGIVNALAFLATGLLLHTLARGDPQRQVRAALLWTVNPLLLYELVAGAHLDSLAVLAAVASVAVLSRSALASGALVGVAATVKAPLAVAGAGLLWGGRTARRSWLRIGVPVIAGAAAVAGGAYAVAGLAALNQLGRTSGYISLATPWHLAEGPLIAWLGDNAGRGLISALAYSCMVGLAVLFCYGLPQHPDSGPTSKAARVALAFALAWLLSAPYVLPWYDAVAWALLALLPWSVFDGLLLARTALLALPYVASLPARLPAHMEWFVTVLRGQIAPVLMVVLVLAFAAAALHVSGTSLRFRVRGLRRTRRRARRGSADPGWPPPGSHPRTPAGR